MRTAGEPPSAPYCIVVSSCDAYSDCWTPFFTLLSLYWKPAPPTVYLNTETQAFAFPGLDIHCPRVGREIDGELAWSERLIRTLDSIPYEIVLYLQEDYFIYDSVDVAVIDKLVDLMRRESISHISLAQCSRPGIRSTCPFLSHIPQDAKYRISAQAGLWNKSALRSYLRRHETVWEFEWYGTLRARRKRDSFFLVNQDYERLQGRWIIPYRPTGIEHGRWVRERVEKLFADHHISVDYAARGFYDPNEDPWHRKPRLIRAARRLRSLR